ncbi:4Fe-4S binding protein [Caloramator sp. mosi_1]|uniref:4Fe-4S binding protein n=1 Tax=Caloramator sp. mosi_1 TaxID=3023090 RepID=UPI00235DD71A|nr:4Fe-4S binding protein [Caloramator sp. mosi_1]WDC83599.1 4Fe-4S binding protein [Caloramator sp. mosi_1]
MFNDIDPYYALFNFWTGEVKIQAIILLIVVLVSSLLIERPWCKYLCPLGAFLGVFNFISIFKIRRNKSICISCKACDKLCPMNIVISDKNVIKNHQCIRCLKCTSEVGCPIENTVYIGTKVGEINEIK